MTQEQTRSALPGGVALVFILLLAAGGIACAATAAEQNLPAVGAIAAALFLTTLLGLFGFIVVNPNEAKVLLLFGAYRGTVKKSGWYWVNPFYSKQRISLRVRNFETEHSKVNDLDGNPVEIASVVVWRVVETAEASFEVEDYVDYVHVQSESALRNLATHYPYDSPEDDRVSLRGSTDEVARKLAEEIQARLDKAGVEVVEARITHLAYAPEIASAMLQRQQAGAIIAARTRIVEGAVGMVEMALDHLSREKIVELDEDRKADMVANLLVVLCGERAPQPIINAGA